MSAPGPKTPVFRCSLTSGLSSGSETTKLCLCYKQGSDFMTWEFTKQDDLTKCCIVGNVASSVFELIKTKIQHVCVASICVSRNIELFLYPERQQVNGADQTGGGGLQWGLINPCLMKLWPRLLCFCSSGLSLNYISWG